MYPTDLRYTKEHEWVRKEGDGTYTVGITHFAQKELGDVVFVEMSKEGTILEAGDELGTVESVKAVSEIFAPAGGTITAVNPAISDDPELVNTDCYGEGWFVKLRTSDGAQPTGLMTAAEYEAYLKEGE